MFQDVIKKIDLLHKEISAMRPLKAKERTALKEYFKIGLTYTSNALEGNSLTETETKIVIEDGITIGGKQLKEHFEVVGHATAYDFMQSLVAHKKISEEDICTLHKLFYWHIDNVRAGVYRKDRVFISGTDFIPPGPKQVPALMKKFVTSMTNLRKKCHPVEFAARLHYDFVVIHPFIDGNGRCARLLMNLALLQNGYPITIIPPILRREYMSAILVCEKKENPATFVHFIAGLVYEAQREYVRLLRDV